MHQRLNSTDKQDSRGLTPSGCRPVAFLDRDLQRDRRATRGFTLVELLISFGIILVLASTIFALSGTMRRRAEAAGCIANMKSLFAGLAAYTTDYKHWPQPPRQILGQEDKFWEFWVDELEEYGISKKTWVCPTARRLSGSNDPDDWKPTYLPAGFDAASPMTPYKWANQPWLLEIGNHHGKGPFVLRPDGSVRPFEAVPIEQQE